ncbi:LINE-1 retrotransposable element ORF2 protein [Cucumis melo var. makuwa]|uniref:LINE-1 retrotransposable element ORF2 protein n=1 Tax=Cucumis melo var. makuwa TaxID=1194695 RepID=A0A5D3CUD6_CUCMM|nr:LINE-1 retrotransposable element ORF2 protein [Cucumis melo var. makuwa]
MIFIKLVIFPPKASSAILRSLGVSLSRAWIGVFQMLDGNSIRVKGSPSGMVLDLWNPISINWDIKPRRPSRSVDLQQLSDLKSVISAPIANGIHDVPISKLASDGSFNVASIKKALQTDEQNQIDVPEAIFINLWKASIPKKM